MTGSGFRTIDDEVFYTVLDELFPDDEDLVKADDKDREARHAPGADKRGSAPKTKAS